MSEATIGMVGGGRVARIILGGWQRAGAQPLLRVVVSDVDPSALESLRAKYPSVIATPDNREAAAQDIVFFGLHPPAFPTVLPEIRDCLGRDAILVSLAPRWSISRISGLLGGFQRVARVIPNAPSIVNRGYNPVSFSDHLTAEDQARVLSLLASLGAHPEVTEDSLEAYAIVAAMGPTYLWYQLYQLISLGCRFGLEREAATAAVTAMVNGAVGTMVESGLGPEAVMDLIPVKPLAAMEETVKASYDAALAGLHEKLKA